jgi:hypothetical protein
MKNRKYFPSEDNVKIRPIDLFKVENLRQVYSTIMGLHQDTTRGWMKQKNINPLWAV